MASCSQKNHQITKQHNGTYSWHCSSIPWRTCRTGQRTRGLNKSASWQHQWWNTKIHNRDGRAEATANRVARRDHACASKHGLFYAYFRNLSHKYLLFKETIGSSASEIVPVLVWAATVHLVYWIAFQLSANIVGPVMGLFYSEYAVLLLALTAPFIIALKLHNPPSIGYSDRLSMLLFAATEGQFHLVFKRGQYNNPFYRSSNGTTVRRCTSDNDAAIGILDSTSGSRDLCIAEGSTQWQASTHPLSIPWTCFPAATHPDWPSVWAILRSLHRAGRILHCCHIGHCANLLQLAPDWTGFCAGKNLAIDNLLFNYLFSGSYPWIRVGLLHRFDLDASSDVGDLRLTEGLRNTFLEN